MGTAESRVSGFLLQGLAKRLAIQRETKAALVQPASGLWSIYSLRVGQAALHSSFYAECYPWLLLWRHIFQAETTKMAASAGSSRPLSIMPSNRAPMKAPRMDPHAMLKAKAP